MKLKAVLFPLVGALSLISCSETNTDNQSKPLETSEITELDSTLEGDDKDGNLDTLKVDGKTVVFFTLSQAEFDSQANDPMSGLDVLIDDFSYYASQTGDSIIAAGYEPVMTASRFIHVTLEDGREKVFDKQSDVESPVGYVISDGIKEPKIYFGVMTESEILADFRQFKK